MDISRDVTYRGFLLNDATLVITPGGGIGSGVSGCVLDSADLSDFDVVQFTEKRSLQDGLDAGDVYLGARRVRLSGTLYAQTKALLFDKLQELRATLSPTLAYRESPGEKGYLPLYFAVPTNRLADYPAGAISLQVLALPRAFQAIIQRDSIGESDAFPLAIPWQATLVCKDPRVMGASWRDTVFSTTTIVTGATAAASTNLISSSSHGLVAGDSIGITSLSGGAGLTQGTRYYVIASGLTSSAFKVSTVAGGAEVDITSDATVLSYHKVVVQGGDNVIHNRGDYHCPVNMLLAVGPQAGKVYVSVGDSQFTINVPASTGDRIIRYNGTEKILTVEEESIEALRMDLLSFQNLTTHPLIPSGLSDLSVTFVGVVVQSGSHLWFWESYA